MPLFESARDLAARTLDHMLARIAATPAEDEPFTHIFLENLFPDDVFRRLLVALPDPAIYDTAAERYRGDTGFVRHQFPVTVGNLGRMPDPAAWRAVAAALTAPELKRAMYTQLKTDLAYRYGCPVEKTGELTGYSRPTLYRETEGFEIPPHPDTRRKIVTMHLYLPADETQLGLGTALYRKKLVAPPAGPWRFRFAKVKQFPFKPNSAYAFVVNNTMMKKSWHGREKLPPGSGVRNTILNTFYEEQRPGFSGYLDEAPPMRKAA